MKSDLHTPGFSCCFKVPLVFSPHARGLNPIAYFDTQAENLYKQIIQDLEADGEGVMEV